LNAVQQLDQKIDEIHISLNKCKHWALQKRKSGGKIRRFGVEKHHVD
jgi:hypothetical protein